MLVEERTLRAIGDSRYLPIPPDWIRSNRITPDTQVMVLVDEAIVVLPRRDYPHERVDEIFRKMATVAKAVL